VWTCEEFSWVAVVRGEWLEFFSSDMGYKSTDMHGRSISFNGADDVLSALGKVFP
jgi:hypothetical protein